MRASMDGDQVRTLRDGDQMEHLALDYEEERILWFNKATGTIDSVNYSGKQYKQIRANTNHILSITVHEGFVFWIDGSNEKLIRAMKSDGHNINTVYQGVGLRKVTIVSAERPGGEGALHSFNYTTNSIIQKWTVLSMLVHAAIKMAGVAIFAFPSAAPLELAHVPTTLIPVNNKVRSTR